MADSRLDDPSEIPDAAPTDEARDPAATESAAPTPDAPQQMVYRRAPKVAPFLVTGAVFGVVLAFFWVALQAPSENYSQGQSISFMSVIFAIVGMTIAALTWLIIDRRSKRIVETVYARRTDDPAAADVALTEDDYSQWSQFQQQHRIETARRDELARAKTAAKATKHNNRK